MNNKDKKENRNKDKFNKKGEDKQFRGRKSVNDVSWYTKYPELASVSTPISFAVNQGLVYDQTSDGTFSGINFKVAPTGIMKINLVPTIGVSNDMFSGVNMASFNTNSFVRHANSGARNYQAPDQTMYYLAFGSVYAFIAELIRLYGLLRSYSVLNKYFARGVIEALGYDVDDLVSHAADLKSFINTFIVKVNQFSVPKSMAYFDRCAMLPSHVFQDRDGEKCVLEVFQYDAFYKFSWKGTEEHPGTMLIPVKYEASTFDEIVTFANSLLTDLLNNDDVYLISGDTLRAFGSENCRVVKYLGEDYAIVPFYDEDVQLTIHNARIHTGLDLNSVQVYQEDAMIKCLPIDNNIVGSNYRQFIFDVLKNDQSSKMEMLLEYSRLHSRQVPGSKEIYSCGTEIVSSIELYAYVKRPDGTSFLQMYDLGYTTYNASMQAANIIPNIKAYSFAAQVNLAPILYWSEAAGSGVTAFIFGALNNFTYTTNEQMRVLDNTALLSLFHVPGVAQQSK